MSELVDRLQALANEAARFGDGMETESDRGVALQAGAFIEDHLERALQERLVSDSGLSDKLRLKTLLGQDRPLGTLSAKIKMAYFVGLIPRNVYIALDTVRRIRNAAAHEWETMDFECGRVGDLCSNLPDFFQYQPGMKPLRLTNRSRFTYAVGWIAAVVLANGLYADRIPSCVALPGIRLVPAEPGGGHGIRQDSEEAKTD